MKEKSYCSSCAIHAGIFLLLMAVSPFLSAQEGDEGVARDSMPIRPVGVLQPLPLDLFPEEMLAHPLEPSEQVNQLPDFSLKGEMYLPYQTNPSPLFRGDYRTNGVLKQFSRGALLGFGGQTSLPGIGRFNEASLGYQYALHSKLTLQLRVNATKINMTGFSGQAFSTSGTLLYRPSDPVAFKFFGSYDIGNSYGMSTHSYGATLSVDMSDRFGMEVGVQRYYDAMRGGWETVPIVIPYYRFDKFTLGLDVGGLLYEVLRELVFDKQRDSGPTIMAPRFSMPPIR